MRLPTFSDPSWPKPPFGAANLRQCVTATLAALAKLALIPALLALYFSQSRTLESWDWDETTCMVERSELQAEKPDRYTLLLSVSFEHQGKQIRLTSDSAYNKQLHADQTTWANARFKAGAHLRCFVDPTGSRFIIGREPETELKLLILAVLAWPILLYFEQFRLLQIRDFLRQLRGKQPRGELKRSSEAARQSRNFVNAAMRIAVSSVIITMGVISLEQYLVHTHAANWQAGQCLVLAQRLKTLTDSTPKHPIVYQHSLGEKLFTGIDFHPFSIHGLSTSDWQRAETLLPGTTTECWIDAHTPYFSTLTQPRTKSAYDFVGPLVLMVLCGALLLILTHRQMMRLYPELSFAFDAEGGTKRLAQWFPIRRYRTRRRNNHYSLSSSSLQPALQALRPVFLQLVFLTGSLLFVYYNPAASSALRAVAGILSIFLMASLAMELISRRNALGEIASWKYRIQIQATSPTLCLGDQFVVKWSAVGRKDYSAIRLIVRAKERFTSLVQPDPARYYSFENQKQGTREAMAFKEVEVFLQERTAEAQSSGTATFSLPTDKHPTVIAPRFASLWVLELWVTTRGKEKRVLALDLDILPQGYPESST